MKTKPTFICVVAVFAGMGIFSDVPAQVEVRIDGQVAIPAGQVDDAGNEGIKYLPGSRLLTVRSVHADIRCVSANADTPEPADGDFTLILDQVNPDTEPEAVYRISDTAGSIELGGNVLEIVTTDESDLQLECAPLRKSFWASDFDNLIGLASSVSGSTDAGGTFTITLTVTNASKSILATAVRVELNSLIEPIDTEAVTGPEFDPSAGTVDSDNVWTVSSLWPLESVTLDATYTVDESPSDTAEVTLEIAGVTADDREGMEPLDTGNPSLVTVVNTGT